MFCIWYWKLASAELFNPFIISEFHRFKGKFVPFDKETHRPGKTTISHEVSFRSSVISDVVIPASGKLTTVIF